MQIKDFASIVASSINRMRATQSKITDFLVGSVARTLIEAPAIEIEECYQQAFIGIREAIPVAVYNAFGFDRDPAVAASGLLTFSTGTAPANPVTTPAGAVFRVPGGAIGYVLQQDVTITAPATTGQGFVVADTAGVGGNTAAATITQADSPTQGVATLSNPAPLVNGVDQESDADRQNRFAAFIASLPRGTAKALAYGGSQVALYNAQGAVTERVQFLLVSEPFEIDQTLPPGYVNVYVHNGVGATTTALVAAVQQALDGYYAADGTPVPGYKAAGVIVTVSAAQDVTVNVSGSLVAKIGYDGSALALMAQTAVATYIAQLPVGQPALEAAITATVMAIDGVYNFVGPTADFAVLLNQKAVPGSIAFTGSSVG